MTPLPMRVIFRDRGGRVARFKIEFRLPGLSVAAEDIKASDIGEVISRAGRLCRMAGGQLCGIVGLFGFFIIVDGTPLVRASYHGNEVVVRATGHGWALPFILAALMLIASALTAGAGHNRVAMLVAMPPALLFLWGLRYAEDAVGAPPNDNFNFVDALPAGYILAFAPYAMMLGAHLHERAQ